LLLWADGEPGENTPAALHTNFRLNPTNGSVVLSRTTGAGSVLAPRSEAQILDYINYREVGPNRSLGSFPAGQSSFRQVFYFVTPGRTNDPSAPLVPLFINEWMAANTSFLPDPTDQAFDDWFELYNPTTNAVDLANYTLTDTFASPRKFTIPPGFTLPARGFLLVWADEDSADNSTNSDLHVNFRLSQNGEQIGLYAPDGRVVDSVTFGAQSNDVSQGRWPDGNAPPFYFMPTPTPRAPNARPPPEIRFREIRFEGANTVTLTWLTEPGRIYRVQYKTDLGEANWSILSGDVTANGDSASRTDNSVQGASQRFYRVLLVQ
jgi:hypothetical protein